MYKCNQAIVYKHTAAIMHVSYTIIFRDAPILPAEFLEKNSYDVKAKSKMLENGWNFGKIVAEGLEHAVVCMTKIEML